MRPCPWLMAILFRRIPAQVSILLSKQVKTVSYWIHNYIFYHSFSKMGCQIEVVEETLGPIGSTVEITKYGTKQSFYSRSLLSN
jgi:hypothetical protein